MEPMTTTAAAGLMAGASALGTLGNLAQSAMNYKFQTELAKKNRIWQRNQWLEENEYNTPKAQMSRMVEAGLNPNLMYGQIQTGQAQPLRVNDPFNSKGIGDALSKLDYQGMLTNLAKSIEEIKALRLSNEGQKIDNLTKRVNLQTSSAESALKGAQWEAALQWHNFNNYQLDKDGFYHHINPDHGALYFLEKMKADLDKTAASTSDINTRRSLNELKKEFQDLVNEYQRTENKWQPWLYGINAGAKILGGLTGAINPFMKLKRVPITYKNTQINNY